MGFPITIHGVVYNEADFLGQGYVTALPAVLTRLNDCVSTYLDKANSTTSVLMGTGAKVFTVPANSMFKVGQYVSVYSTVTQYMFGYITAYTHSTGSLTIDIVQVVGAGTLSSWTISRASHMKIYPSVPLGIHAGGTGEGTFNSLALEFNPRAVYRSGFNLINLDASDLLQAPYYYTVSDGVAGSGNAVLKGNAAVNKSAISLTSAAYGQVEDVGDKVFCSLGELGFLSLYNSGDLSALVRISGDSPAATENYVIRIGLATNNAAALSDHEQYGAFGVEVTYGTASIRYRYFCKLPGVEEETEGDTTLYGFGTSYKPFSLRYNHLNQELSMGGFGGGIVMDLSPFIEKLRTLGGSFRAAMMLRPFFYMEKTVGTAIKAMAFQDFEIEQHLRRA